MYRPRPSARVQDTTRSGVPSPLRSVDDHCCGRWIGPEHLRFARHAAGPPPRTSELLEMEQVSARPRLARGKGLGRPRQERTSRPCSRPIVCLTVGGEQHRSRGGRPAHHSHSYGRTTAPTARCRGALSTNTSIWPPSLIVGERDRPRARRPIAEAGRAATRIDCPSRTSSVSPPRPESGPPPSASRTSGSPSPVQIVRRRPRSGRSRESDVRPATCVASTKVRPSSRRIETGLVGRRPALDTGDDHVLTPVARSDRRRSDWRPPMRAP